MSVSATASTPLKNFPHLAAKLVDQGTPNQEMSAPAHGSCAIRTAISQYFVNLCSPSECTAGEFWKQAKCSNTYSISIDCTALAFSISSLHRTFVLCLYSILTASRRNRKDKILQMRACLKWTTLCLKPFLFFCNNVFNREPIFTFFGRNVAKGIGNTQSLTCLLLTVRISYSWEPA